MTRTTFLRCGNQSLWQYLGTMMYLELICVCTTYLGCVYLLSLGHTQSAPLMRSRQKEMSAQVSFVQSSIASVSHRSPLNTASSITDSYSNGSKVKAHHHALKWEHEQYFKISYVYTPEDVRIRKTLLHHFEWNFTGGDNRLVGIIVKASALEWKIRSSISACAVRIFPCRAIPVT